MYKIYMYVCIAISCRIHKLYSWSLSISVNIICTCTCRHQSICLLSRLSMPLFSQIFGFQLASIHVHVAASCTYKWLKSESGRCVLYEITCLGSITSGNRLLHVCAPLQSPSYYLYVRICTHVHTFIIEPFPFCFLFAVWTLTSVTMTTRRLFGWPWCS
jgi:hypothetical protein